MQCCDHVLVCQLCFDEVAGRQVFYDLERARHLQRLAADLIVKEEFGQAEDQLEVKHSRP